MSRQPLLAGWSTEVAAGTAQRSNAVVGGQSSCSALAIPTVPAAVFSHGQWPRSRCVRCGRSGVKPPARCNRCAREAARTASLETVPSICGRQLVRESRVQGCSRRESTRAAFHARARARARHDAASCCASYAAKQTASLQARSASASRSNCANRRLWVTPSTAARLQQPRPPIRRRARHVHRAPTT